MKVVSAEDNAVVKYKWKVKKWRDEKVWKVSESDFILLWTDIQMWAENSVFLENSRLIFGFNVNLCLMLFLWCVGTKG